jgi:hypothetical protein
MTQTADELADAKDFDGYRSLLADVAALVA